MITELGHYALILALATALVQSLVPLIGAQRNDAGMMAVGPMAANLSFVLVAFSFLTLTYAYVISDFSLLNVVENSHSMKPMLYKITGVWGNHEGSMLLWVLILVLFSSLVASFGRNLPDKLRANVLSVQAWITVAFLLFILLTSNPFIRLTNPPAEGNDLNPILQDLGLAIHPPLLYLGYVGFSISFSFAAAALIEGRLDAAWARWVRPWTLVAWTFLTAGISMGSYWAYYELGWGGWWFWDPVENASFMPWLAGTALLHSALVMEKREALKVWTVLLSILTFSFSLLGTFLVRSGVLTSVHAFATDPARGVFILGILAVFIGGAFALFGLRATALRTGGLFAPISREGALVLNNLFLTTATATVFVGTLYPLLLEATTGTKISVGAPFFNLTFGPLMIPLMIAVPFGPLLAWKRGDLMGATQRLYAAIGISILVGLVVMAFTTDEPVLAAAGMALGVFVILGALTDLVHRSGIGRLPAATAWSRFKGLPRSAFGTAFAHAGLGITMIGVVAASVYSTEHVSAMSDGDTVDAGGYTVRFDGLKDVQGPNYTAKSGEFIVSNGGVEVARVASAKRFYPARQMPTTEAGILTFGASQLYIALGDMESNGKLVVRVWWKSWVTFIWYGTVLMMIGGALSLSDRRLRIGAPRKAARPVKTAEAVA